MFWRGVLGYLPANLVQGLTGVLTLVVFTRLLSPAQFGHYALGFSVMGLLHTGLLTWNEAALARFQAGAEQRGDAHHHAATVLRAWMLLAGVVALASGVAAALPLEPGLKLAVVAGALAVLPRSFAKIAQERRRAIGDVRGAVTIDLVQSIGAFAIGAACAWAGFGGAAPLIGIALAAVLSVAWAVPAELAAARGGTAEAGRALTYARYGLPVAGSLILSLVLTSTDRFLLAAFLDDAAVGVYHAGYSLANRTLDVMFIWLGAAGGPALVMALERGGQAGLAPQAREQAALMWLLGLPAAVGLAMVAAPLSQVMLGPQLADGAAQVTPWIAASALLAGITTYYYHQAFTLGRRTGLLLAAMAAPAVANVALNLLLIPRFGLQGALWATLASFALGLAASAGLGRRAMALPTPWVVIAQAAGATAAMATVVSMVPPLGGVAELAAKSSVGIAVYGALALVMDAGALRSRALPLARRLATRLAA
ncbi:MAG: lipopolysaccharide biosynthesis protein [Phenylobacterium sp.]